MVKLSRTILGFFCFSGLGALSEGIIGATLVVALTRVAFAVAGELAAGFSGAATAVLGLDFSGMKGSVNEW
jgi:hypothetical protein